MQKDLIENPICNRVGWMSTSDNEEELLLSAYVPVKKCGKKFLMPSLFTE